MRQVREHDELGYLCRLSRTRLALHDDNLVLVECSQEFVHVGVNRQLLPRFENCLVLGCVWVLRERVDIAFLV